ncbi:uncharacterized protein LOC135225587 isoform X1 [Macrobrachium nipponense]|uniref:uncharacterized protein LOC135225587 isoform X1 n=1 Tax=Macrobrachium nipponense TaxID=159736 RepID=UPI0030C87ECB
MDKLTRFNRLITLLLLILLLSTFVDLGSARDADYYLERWSKKGHGPADHHHRLSPIISQPSLVTSPPNVIPSYGNTSLSTDFANGTENRNSRFFQISISPVFPLFSLITIANTPCSASGGSNGTCYSANQCKNLGGAASGTCAQGLGTCCVFQTTCGGQASQNCTYFVNDGYPKVFNGASSCQLRVNKMNSSVCQLRLDFDNFILSPPESKDHQCLNDRFYVSGGTPVPVICGTNTGNHMYVDIGNTLPLVLTVVTMGPSFDRSWKIKVTQIPCNSDYTAPTNCLQWFQGVSGQIKSYNFDLTSGLQLSNQDYSICIRTEKNFCGIQYAACADAVNTQSQSFTVTGRTTGGTRVGSRVGATSCPFDWLLIPCVSANSQKPFTSCQERLCGDSFNVIESTTAGNVVVYSQVKPFVLVYHTDDKEETSVPTENDNRGFCLDYVQQPCV